jgi:hypothetical protein
MPVSASDQIRLLDEPSSGERDARISQCGTYRYWLTRRWGRDTDPRVCWIMLNPSTGDHLKDDATIRRCIGYSRTWGAGSLVVVNLFALRTAYPSYLWGAQLSGLDIVGQENDEAIAWAVGTSARRICAWGGHGTRAPERVARVLELVGPGAECLTITKGGHPGHPVRLPANLEPIPYPGLTTETAS